MGKRTSGNADTAPHADLTGGRLSGHRSFLTPRLTFSGLVPPIGMQDVMGKIRSASVAA